MNALEELGLLKMDFLGLRNLTVIKKTVDLIKTRHNLDIDISKIDLTDQKVYQEIFQKAFTTGIFQFESDGMKEYLVQLEPKSIESLMQMTALYRPGPMANIPEFIARKQGKKSIKYLHPNLEIILKETFGIIVYQEQVIQISSEIGGFNLAEADLLRRAMGKKKKSLMASFKVKFIEGAVKKNINKSVAIEIFELLEKFAEYGFNKSHAASYTIISYQTAWLKCHYPIEFLTANISSDINDTDRVNKMLAEAKRMKIEIKPPNINYSKAGFHILDDKTIQYGLAAIKNVGYKSAQSIANYQEKNGSFNSIFDLCVMDEPINKKVLESLILVGACDDLKEHRAQLFNSMDVIIDFNNKYNKNKNSNQASLFGKEEESSISYPTIQDYELWEQEKCLKHEKDLLGFYLTDNPLSKYEDDIKEFSVLNKFNKKNIYLSGIITEVQLRFDKNGNKWALVTLDTLNNVVQAYIFNDVFIKSSHLIQEDMTCFLIARDFNNSESENTTRVIVNNIYQLEGLRSKIVKNINIR